MQLPVQPGLVEKYLRNTRVRGEFDSHRAGGFACRIQDVTERTAAGVAESHGLDKAPDWPSTGPLHVLRFYAHNPALFNTPFGARTTASASRFDSAAVYPAPFLGTGYTPSETHVVPEYFMPYTELPAGAELWRIEESGQASRIGVYGHRQLGWIPTEPEPQAAAPSPLHSSVRRGLIARLGQQEFEADYGYRPGQLVLHPVQGSTVPADFEQRDGISIKSVGDVELDEIAYYRQLSTWRGAPFEVLERDEATATLNFLGENYEQAAELGLNEVSYRIWHTTVPRSELGEVSEEKTVFAVQSHFGQG